MAKPAWEDLGGLVAAAALDKLAELAEIPVVRRRNQSISPARQPSVAPKGAPVRTLAICASTGGPAALASLLPLIVPVLPKVTTLIVQHILPGFAPVLAAWLAESTGVNVEVATDGAELGRRQVLLAPDGRHLAVDLPARVRIMDLPPIRAHRPSASLLFESVARAFKDQVLAVILTGMGREGVDGLRRVRDCHGVILVQDPETCAVPGMPQAAIHEGLADLVLAPEPLGLEIVDRIGLSERGKA